MLFLLLDINSWNKYFCKNVKPQPLCFIFFLNLWIVHWDGAIGWAIRLFCIPNLLDFYRTRRPSSRIFETVCNFIFKTWIDLQYYLQNLNRPAILSWKLESTCNIILNLNRPAILSLKLESTCTIIVKTLIDLHYYR